MNQGKLSKTLSSASSKQMISNDEIARRKQEIYGLYKAEENHLSIMV